ncbi:hypothetical protein [Nesterenkonia jeotgali]|uniref:Uncharacterized protein n=1 Tax=Nesterenkonia jeotgali TaxID=317018 RepID=A0A839FHV0_9MICC|nr:hypothetical protein [Nesterenkonia jeotgali]MBA8921348.1 hypothetical protein [Nesterenkonia jeotgali]
MTLTTEQINQLNAWASGSLPLMAAVHLLTSSPQREKLWPALVRTRHDDTPWLALDSAPTLVDSFGFSSGERAVALLVIELGEQDTGVSLADLLSSLDQANARAFYESARLLTHGR